MHLTRSHSEIVEDILRMGEVGYNASERDSLPLLFFEVYSIELKTGCEQCKRSGFDSLIRWANRKKPKNSYMDFKIKKQFEGKDFHFRHAGKLVVVNSNNLNADRVKMILASPYAHVIEGQEDKVEPVIETSPNELEASIALTSTEAKSDGKTFVKTVKGKLSKSNVSKQSKVGKQLKKEK